jgi:hypothetical protein
MNSAWPLLILMPKFKLCVDPVGGSRRTTGPSRLSLTALTLSAGLLCGSQEENDIGLPVEKSI